MTGTLRQLRRRCFLFMLIGSTASTRSTVIKDRSGSSDRIGIRELGSSVALASESRSSRAPCALISAASKSHPTSKTSRAHLSRIHDGGKQHHHGRETNCHDGAQFSFIDKIVCPPSLKFVRRRSQILHCIRLCFS